jgi:hypothetical protein
VQLGEVEAYFSLGECHLAFCTILKLADLRSVSDGDFAEGKQLMAIQEN